MSFLMTALGSYGFPRNPPPPAHLEARVGDLVPDDRREVVESEPSAGFLDARVKRNHDVAAMPTPGQAHIADDDDQPPAGDQNPVAFAPSPSEFLHESVVVADRSKLALPLVVLLEGPVRRRRDHKLDGPVGKPRQVAGVPGKDEMLGRHFPNGGRHPRRIRGVPRHAGERRLKRPIGQGQVRQMPLHEPPRAPARGRPCSLASRAALQDRVPVPDMRSEPVEERGDVIHARDDHEAVTAMW